MSIRSAVFYNFFRVKSSYIFVFRLIFTAPFLEWIEFIFWSSLTAFIFPTLLIRDVGTMGGVGWGKRSLRLLFLILNLLTKAREGVLNNF